MAPRVSLGLPVYNGENFVEHAIDSVIKQDLNDFELVIADNASTDGTEAICRAAAAQDRRIKYVRNPQNLGAATYYNLCFSLTSGQYFKWCAHDDFISPNFLTGCVRVLDKEDAAVIAYGKMEYVDAEGKIIPRTADQDPEVSVFEVPLPDMRHMSPAARFRLLASIGGSDNAMFGLMRRVAVARTSLHRKYYMSDRALLAEMALLGIFVRAYGVVLYNRDHPGRSTKIASKAGRSTWTNPAAKTNRSFEHLSLLSHHFENAFRYRHTAALWVTVPYLIGWAANPLRLGWCILELIGIVSPSLRVALGRFAWRVANFAVFRKLIAPRVVRAQHVPDVKPNGKA